MKSLFEELGGTYTLGEDGKLHPNLTIEATDRRPLGRWGKMHRVYLEEVQPILYLQLMLNGTLYNHLVDVNERATEMLNRLVKQMAEQEGVTERLNAELPIDWVGRMNNIRHRAEEIIREEIMNTL